MKTAEAFFIVTMGILGTLSEAGKLLKVPRIYNALITSDQNLQPSQAYPAISPVIQGIYYPVSSYSAYSNIVPIQQYGNVQYIRLGCNSSNFNQHDQSSENKPCYSKQVYNNYATEINNETAYNGEQNGNQYSGNNELSVVKSQIMDPENTNNEERAFSERNYLPISDLIKNNRPKDPSIVDVPPPPLPIGKHENAQPKNSQEYPPPPLGFIF